MNVYINKGPQGGVLTVELYSNDQSVILAGYCRYWHQDNIAGCFNCEHHQEFGGPMGYMWTGSNFIRHDIDAPASVEILHGEWVSDEEWFK